MEKNFLFMMRAFFAVSNNPQDDVNPFDDIKEFSIKKIGDLAWGLDSDARKSSKFSFAVNFNTVLKVFKVILPAHVIFISLKDDSSIEDVVSEWVSRAQFL